MFDKRAKKYDNLQWVNQEGYVDKIMSLSGIRSDSRVCDVGTGTGIMAEELARYGKSVTAVDNCKEMLDIAIKKRSSPKIKYVLHDVSRPFKEKNFDCVVARMAFHHIDNDKIAAENCINSLAKWGRLVIAEGIPQEGTEDFYCNVFEIKEKRRVYSIRQLIRLFSGLKGITITMHQDEGMSVWNWLNNSGLPKDKQQQIFDMHLDAPQYVQRAYKMRFIGGDILMNWRTAIVSGRKM